MIPVFIFSCSNTNTSKSDEQLINDIFLDMVGTQGYTGSLIPLPPLPSDTIPRNTNILFT